MGTVRVSPFLVCRSVNLLRCISTSDVSSEYDGRLKRAYDTGFGGLARKERTYEAVEVFGGTDRVRDPTGRSQPPVGDLCWYLDVSDATFYASKYAYLGVRNRLRQVEEENNRLKRLVADLSLDKHMRAEAVRKKSTARSTAEAEMTDKLCLLNRDS